MIHQIFITENQKLPTTFNMCKQFLDILENGEYNLTREEVPKMEKFYLNALKMEIDVILDLYQKGKILKLELIHYLKTNEQLSKAVGKADKIYENGFVNR